MRRAVCASNLTDERICVYLPCLHEACEIRACLTGLIELCWKVVEDSLGRVGFAYWMPPATPPFHSQSLLFALRPAQIPAQIARRFTILLQAAARLLSANHFTHVCCCRALQSPRETAKETMGSVWHCRCQCNAPLASAHHPRLFIASLVSGG